MNNYENLQQLYAATAQERDKLKKERDALLQILKEQACCELCKHDATPLPCKEEEIFDHGCGEACCHERAICCNCGGNNWEWKGLEGYHAEA